MSDLQLKDLNIETLDQWMADNPESSVTLCINVNKKLTELPFPSHSEIGEAKRNQLTMTGAYYTVVRDEQS
ncbi:MAG: hypothetical protein OXS28_11815 [Gammaproteobacteria bacterium]|nr:hypothetical protein [Gammaproteobacteria bacterium]MDE0286359.1 hypothetical protein [Gammaproteobacteria bacterium]